MLKKAMSVFLIFAVITQMSFPASAIIPGEDSYVAEGHLIDDPAFLASAEVVEMDDSIKLMRISNNGVVGNRTQYRSDVVQIFIENEENKDALMTQLTMRPPVVKSVIWFLTIWQLCPFSLPYITKLKKTECLIT